MKRIRWTAVASIALALSCGGSEAPSPDPDIVAGAGFLRCDEYGRPFIREAWARLDVHAGNRDLTLRIVRARYVLDGGVSPGDFYDAAVSKPDATVGAGTDTTVYFDVSFRSPLASPIKPRTYALALDVEAGGRTWSVQSPEQAPNCGP